MNRFVYLDNNATTRLDNGIVEKVKPYLELQYGNPSSSYNFGKKIKNEIDNARLNVATVINANPKNIIFTSGGSEGNVSAFNHALKLNPTKRKVITTKIEHASIIEYCNLLSKADYQIIYLNIDINGKIDVKQLESEIDNNTAIVSIQWANNETGIISNIDEINKVIEKKKKQFNFIYHIDGVQVLGKMIVDVKSSIADIISFSGHKIHALKGIGFMYIKNSSEFIPLITGHQENNLRGGTENVIGIVTIGEACKILNDNLNEYINRMKETQSYLEIQLKDLPLNINGKKSNRLPNTTSITFNDMNGNETMYKLEANGICVSTGSACNSESSEPSYVLTAMGVKNPQNTIRISIDNTTTHSQIDYFVNKLKEIIKEK